WRDSAVNASAPSPRLSRGEGRGEGPRHAPTPEQAAAPHPNPLPTEEWGEGTPRVLPRAKCAWHTRAPPPPSVPGNKPNVRPQPRDDRERAGEDAVCQPLAPGPVLSGPRHQHRH